MQDVAIRKECVGRRLSPLKGWRLEALLEGWQYLSVSDRKIRVFATADIGDPALERLRELGYQVEVHPQTDAPPKSVILEKVRSGIDALITTLRDPIDEEVFAGGAGTLKIVAQIAVGFDNIDREAANRYRIPFANTADVLTEATAEFAFFTMGALSRKLHPSEELVIENRWTSWHPYQPFLGDEVTGKTVAVIGTGRIGKAFAKKCIGIDMDLLLYDPILQDQKFVEFVRREMELRFEARFTLTPRSVSYTSFEEALEEADYVSVHVPLLMPGESSTPTHHLMDEGAFKRMKQTAYLINTSRGPVVDEAALYQALINNEIAGAALDVYEKEPLPPDSPLRDRRLKDRLRLFHHFASGTRETRLSADPDVGMAGRAVQAVIDVIERRYDGDPAKMPYVVNKEAFLS
ncbi:MAG TPA: NAD(P)-dependent oxidoreductase [Blastocatellia bacterium]|nr:NAD(P)-dependent oxidoreductase [Blastocatellia bacterium]